MRIEEKVDKYLVEISKRERKEAKEKIRKTMKSIKSKGQVQTVLNMIVDYYRRFGQTSGNVFKDLWDFLRGAWDYDDDYELIEELIFEIKKKQKEGKLPKDIEIKPSDYRK